jgi:alpha-beta hydrolase superfamily lysophospholipase
MTTPGIPSADGVQMLFAEASDGLGLHDPGTLRSATGVSLNALRRGNRRGGMARVGSVALVERNGVLQWELGLAKARIQDQRRMRTRWGLLGRLIGRKEYIALQPNEIGKYLEDLDKQLTPSRGLRQWDASCNPMPLSPSITKEGNILLIIHGTFSKSDHLFDDLRRAPNGLDFIGRAARRYKYILSFDHPTVSVSPMLNALDLRTALGESAGPVDIICHSRGGLVARWWMEALDPYPTRTKRCVFVASPLGGTSLAAPPRLRAGLNALANLSRLLGTAAMALPLMKAPAAILRVIGSVVGVASRTPLVDAAVAMIPGLASQSRTSNNAELIRLNGRTQNAQYFFVRSDFQSTNPGWDIFRLIRETKIRAVEAAADLLVFPGQNDLIVDCDSMTGVPGITPGPGNLFDFGTNDNVYHTNYFENPGTVDFISRVLRV